MQKYSVNVVALVPYYRVSLNGDTVANARVRHSQQRSKNVTNLFIVVFQIIIGGVADLFKIVNNVFAN